MSLKTVTYYVVLTSLLLATLYQLVEAHDLIVAENGRKAVWKAVGAILAASSAAIMLAHPSE